MTRGRLCAVALLLLTAGCTADRKPNAPYVGADDTGCMSCSDMSPEQFESALIALRQTPHLRADVFVLGAWPNYPVSVPLRVVENGAKCTVADHDEVAKLVALVSELKWSGGTIMGVQPAVEIRFYREGHASARPVFEAFFSWGFSWGPFKEGGVWTAIVNGRFVNFDHKDTSRLEDFAWELADQDKFCEPDGNK
jgi:hypothetical protein